MEFNCEGQNRGNNGGIMMYNYGLDNRELGEQFLVLTTRITNALPYNPKHRITKKGLVNFENS